MPYGSGSYGSLEYGGDFGLSTATVIQLGAIGDVVFDDVMAAAAALSLGAIAGASFLVTADGSIALHAIAEASFTASGAAPTPPQAAGSLGWWFMGPAGRMLADAGFQVLVVPYLRPGGGIRVKK